MSHYYHISSDTHVLFSIKMQVTESLQTWLICDTVITAHAHPYFNSCTPSVNATCNHTALNNVNFRYCCQCVRYTAHILLI